MALAVEKIWGESDLKIVGHKDIVGVNGEAVLDPKESLDPKSGTRSHAGEMNMKMVNAEFLKPYSDVSCLVQAK